MDLFSQNLEKNKKTPLAVKMRPRNLGEYIGQEHIVGKGCLLRRAIQADRMQSIIFYGPAGTGKTTLAKIIANTTESVFISLNAVTSGVKDIRAAIREAERRLGQYNKKTILFIDEIHRFNKSQQDALLPSVEEGIITLIGATTENPYFEINSPLVSRSRIFQLKLLEKKDIINIMQKALKDKERGLGEYNVDITEEALNHLAEVSNGDARQALNALELAVLTTIEEKGVIKINLEVAEESIQQKAVSYDQSGDNHYDTISAFIKSMRGSDPDATLYWLAKMLKAGEDPRFIARRMIVHASEDVGLANPSVLTVAVAAAHALDFVGLPEAKLNLAQAALYIACSPKSNAVCNGINEALNAVNMQFSSGVPKHLRDTHYKGASKLENGIGYKFPHNYPNNYVRQQYLPDELQDETFYHPTNNGVEKKINDFLKMLEDN
ncbi:MAG: AAA family ATPase [bacterium]